MNTFEERIKSSVFHFTEKKNDSDLESLDKILSIVENGFYPRYSKEILNKVVKPLGKDNYFRGVPMVCFCGLGLVKIQKHIDNFGKFGIGLTGEWALRKRINPVSYMVPNSIAVERFNSMQDFFINKYLGDRKIQDWYKFLEFSSLIQNIKYYEEREWRHLPDLEDIDGISKVLDEVFYDGPYSDLIIQNENNKLKNIPLQFDDKDINFIIVPKLDIKKAKLGLNMINNQLCNKLISTEEIIEKYG